MEFVGAPVTELRSLITSSFEEWARDGGRSVALSGGATAMIFLGALKDANVNWKRITLFWADERAVAPDDPESNYGTKRRS
jgi:6-phosphogluconolactonase